MTRPTTPAGAITAMSALMPSLVPLSMVIVRNSGLAPPAMTLAPVVDNAVVVFRSSSFWSDSRLLRETAFLL